MTSSLRKTKLIFRQLEQQTVLLLSLWIALNWIRTQQLNALCTLCVQIYNTSVYVLLWKKSAWKRDNGMNYLSAVSSLSVYSQSVMMWSETSTCWGAPRWIWKPLLWLKTQQRFKVRLLCSKWAKTCWFTETSAVVSLTEAPLRGSSHWS